MQPLLHINWNITYRCPLDCRHCYSRSRASGRELDLDGKMRVVESIVRSGIFSVNLGGGEPVFAPDTLHVLDALSSAGIWTTLCTSGWNVGAREVEAVAERGLKTAFVSLDDDRAEGHDALRGARGCFDDAVKAMGLFVGHGVGVGVSTVVTKANLSRLERIVDVADESGAQSVEFKRLKPQGNAEGLCDLLLDAEDEAVLFETVARLKQRRSPAVSLIYGPVGTPGIDEGCPCAKTIVTILDDGTVAPCVYNPEPIGNALEDDLLDLWSNSEVLKRFREAGSCAGLEAEMKLSL